MWAYCLCSYQYVDICKLFLFKATFDPRYIGQDFLATMFKYDLVYLDGKPVTEESVYDKHYKKVKLKVS